MRACRRARILSAPGIFCAVMFLCPALVLAQELTKADVATFSAASKSNAKNCASNISSTRAVPSASGHEISIATQNMWRFFDDVDDGSGDLLTTAEYQLRLNKLSRQIVHVLRSPDVLAVQEVENIKVLDDLAAAVSAQGGKKYQSVLLEGHDWGGIDVGFLLRADIKVLSREQILKTRRLDRAALFDRPPLWLRVQVTDKRVLNIVNVHLKSLRGSSDPALSKKTARKRQHQAEALAEWVGLYLAKPAAEPLLVLGDFNASYAPSLGANDASSADALGGVDVMAIVQAEGLSNQWSRLPEAERYSYVHDCRAETLDHVLASAALLPAIKSLAVSRGNAGVRAPADRRDSSALRSSDHDALVLYLVP